MSENWVYGNQFATIYDDPVVFRDGSSGRHLRIVEADGRPGVAMLPVFDNRIAIVLIYRYPITSWEWGIPRGYSHGGDPAESARMELIEELGAEPNELIPIGNVTPNSGLLASQVSLFLARYEQSLPRPKDATEVLTVKWINIQALRDEIERGNIVDGFTLSAILAAWAHGLIDLPGQAIC